MHSTYTTNPTFIIIGSTSPAFHFLAALRLHIQKHYDLDGLCKSGVHTKDFDVCIDVSGVDRLVIKALADVAEDRLADVNAVAVNCPTSCFISVSF